MARLAMKFCLEPQAERAHGHGKWRVAEARH
jgi:hypothetical protein